MLFCLKQKIQTGSSFIFVFQLNQPNHFNTLTSNTQNQLKDLYVDYFFRRQDDFWRKEAMKKLPALKRSTNMLICGEDLGLVPGSVPEVMKQLGLLSLEIQRMPKQTDREFFHPERCAIFKRCYTINARHEHHSRMVGRRPRQNTTIL